MVAWLPALEKELSALEPHADFRLWLTTEPHDQFPPLLLQQSLKVRKGAPESSWLIGALWSAQQDGASLPVEYVVPFSLISGEDASFFFQIVVLRTYFQHPSCFFLFLRGWAGVAGMPKTVVVHLFVCLA